MSLAPALDAPAVRRNSDDGRVIGELVGGDKFVVGDLTNTYAAIGAGASVIVQKARSRVGEIKREERFIEERLADGLEAQLDRYRRLAEMPAFAPSHNPYRALKSYEIEHAGLFYGRGADIARLWGYLDRPLSVVRAESGAGKSSLLKAGLASRLLAGGHLPIYLRPIDRYPGDELKAWFVPDFDTQPGYERLRDDSLTGFLERVTRLVGGRVVVVLIDQFEEFFYYQPESERKRFAAELADCVERLRGGVRWLFAIRDEKYSGFGEFHPAINLSFHDTYALCWTPAQARETIIEPARLCGLSYELPLPDRIIADLTEDGRALSPLHLQLVCHTLFEARHGDPRPIETADYDRLGAARGILEHYLQDVLARSADEADREAARFVLGELVTSDFRRARRSAAALLAQWRTVAPDSRVALPHVINALVANGLLVVRGADETAEYELTHDFLAQRIQLDPQTRARKLAGEMLAQDVHLWRASPPAAEALIPAERLARIEPFAAALALGDDERELLRRSRAQVEAEEARELARLAREVAVLRARSRLQRALLAVFAVGTLVALYLVAQPYVLRYRAANAVSLVPVPELGVAFEAYEVTNERYDWCVDARACDRADGFAWIEANWEVSSQLPVVGVDAADAMDFCNWIGRMPPTVEHWDAVAPPFEEWSQMEPDKANLCRLSLVDCFGEGVQLQPVGGRTIHQYGAADDPAGGIYDLVGSVDEWTRTQRVDDFVNLPTLKNLDSIDPAEVNILALGDSYREQIDSAGSYDSFAGSYTSSYTKNDMIGIRCVQ
jgi:formylglycine-generating enzyme required for sulfatase activity